MPYCRNCGARISKFNQDLCPICGAKEPLKGVSTETNEITSQVDISAFKEGQKVLRRRKVLLLLFILLGFVGTPFLYIKKIFSALFWFLFNFAIIASIYFLLSYVLKLDILIAFVIAIASVYLLNIIVGIIYFKIPNLKDGDGEFVC